MTTQTYIQTETAISTWFNGFINLIKEHRDQLQAGTLNKNLEDYYNSLIAGNMDDAANMSNNQIQKYFITKMLSEYLQCFGEKMPLFLAFDITQTKLLVWAIIKENDIDIEKHLYLTEAKINAKFDTYNFCIDTSIIESNDKIAIPSHYKIFHGEF